MRIGGARVPQTRERGPESRAIAGTGKVAAVKAVPRRHPLPSLLKKEMKMGLILLVIIILLLIGAFPTWPHSQSWGYGPSGILGVILVVVLILFLLGRI